MTVHERLLLTYMYPASATLESSGIGLTAETELVGDEEIQEVEEALEVEEEDGITLEPFNLAQERRDGYFDEGGHYVEHKNKDEEEVEKDAWYADTKGGEHMLMQSADHP